jgi:hypothetical protein
MTNSAEILIKLPELPVIEIVDDLIQVYKEFMVIRAALKLKLFDWIEERGPVTIDEISAGTGIVREYIAGLIGLLFYLDLVRRSDEKFSLSPSASLHFVSTSMYYQGDVILALSEKGSPWDGIDEYITTPGSKRTFEPENRHSTASLAEQEMRGMVKNITTVISRWAGFTKAGSFVEVGSGHGLYAIAACQLHPALTAVVYQPPGSTVLQENISRFGVETRITTCGDEILKGSGIQTDILLVSHALYPYVDTLEKKVQSLASCLKEGGLFVSNHWISRKQEGTGMQGLYELELALHNRYHLIPNQEEYEEICSQSGLDIFQTGMIRTAYGESTVHMAIKGKKGER